MFRYLILGLLRSGESRHGYALMKEYHDRSGVHISSGNFYRELARLVGEGLVRATSKPIKSDPRRVPYEITDDGAAAFDDWLAAPNEPPATHYEDDLSARALFVADAGEAAVRQLLARWQDDLWVRVKTLERARELALTRRREAGVEGFEPLTHLLARRMKHVAADLEFLDELRKAHESWSTSERSRGHDPARVSSNPSVIRRRS